MTTDSGRQWQPTPEIANLLRTTSTHNINRAVALLLQDSTNRLLMQIPETAADVKFENGELQLHPLVKAAAAYRAQKATLAETAEIFKASQPKLDAAHRRAMSVSTPSAATYEPGEEDIMNLIIAVNDLIQGDIQLKRLESVAPAQAAVDRKPDMELGGTRLWFT